MISPLRRPLPAIHLRARWLMVALTATTPAATACHSCFMMWAPSTVTLNFGDAAWEPGVWQLEVNGYTQDALCVVSLPHVDGELVSCGLNAALSFDADGGVASMTLTEFAPDGFSLYLTRDGAGVFQEEFTPSYDLTEPNGPGCGERRTTTIQVDL